MFFVSNWLLCNAIVCFLLFFFQYLIKRTSDNNNLSVLLFLAVYSGITFSIKALLAFLNHMKFYLCCCFGSRKFK